MIKEAASEDYHADLCEQRHGNGSAEAEATVAARQRP